jgi:hypothetical protein
MTNNTEQRRAFEEWAIAQRDRNNLPYFVMKADNGRYVDEGTNHAWEGWQAALAQRQQTAPKQDELAESSCTAEEAEELMKDCTDYKVTDCCFSLSGRELAEIINADRAKR